MNSKRLVYYSIIFCAVAAIGIILLFETKTKCDWCYETKQNAIVIYPIFTQTAYQPHSFYDYYKGKCGKECLTSKIYTINPTLGSSQRAYQVFKIAGYPMITDIDLINKPDILNDFKWVIILHNEYVTKEEYKIITSQKHVLFAYANPLYAEVSYTEKNNTITLIKGHGYPDKSIKNGLGFKYDNSPFEYDRKCQVWNYTKLDNGILMNCYPDEQFNNPDFMLFIKHITELD